MQTAEALLIGFLGALLLVALLVLLYVLKRIDGRLDSIEQQVVAMQKWLQTGTDVLCKVADELPTLRTLADALTRTARSMNQTTAAIRGISGLLVAPQTPAAEELGPAMWTRGAPPNPLFEQYASAQDSGYLEQTDEQLAEIERQNLLREQGIETDPLRIPAPGPGMINMTDAG